MPAYPHIEFTLSVGTWDTGGELYPDTGFEGALAIPVGVSREIVAEPDTAPFRMADGSLIECPTWYGQLCLKDHVFPVEVVAVGNQFLLGREVLDQLEICFRFGREVRLSFADG